MKPPSRRPLESHIDMAKLSDSEKEKTKLRERQRRAVTTKIFAGLRKYGNYNLPPRADMNDVLRALAGEAGWIVESDGTTYRNQAGLQPENSLVQSLCLSRHGQANQQHPSRSNSHQSLQIFSSPVEESDWGTGPGLSSLSGLTSSSSFTIRESPDGVFCTTPNGTCTSEGDAANAIALLSAASMQFPLQLTSSASISNSLSQLQPQMHSTMHLGGAGGNGSTNFLLTSDRSTLSDLSTLGCLQDGLRKGSDNGGFATCPSMDLGRDGLSLLVRSANSDSMLVPSNLHSQYTNHHSPSDQLLVSVAPSGDTSCGS